jgi:hypothetical protein
MKSLKVALRLSTLLRTMPSFKPKANMYTLTATSLTAGCALFFGSQKILT